MRYETRDSQRLDDETGLVYMRARYYEPTTGRFISEDPARDGVNWYLYGAGNSLKYVDPDGKVIYGIMGLVSLALSICLSIASRHYDWSEKTHVYVLVARWLFGIMGTILSFIQLKSWATDIAESWKQRIEIEIIKQKSSVGPGSNARKIEAALIEQVYYLWYLDWKAGS